MPPYALGGGTERRVLGIEILSVSKALAPGDWQKARLPGKRGTDAAE